MRFRFKAFGWHLLGSASALTLTLGLLYLGWYHWPGWYLADMPTVLAIMVGVDVVLGPLLTLHRREPREGPPRAGPGRGSHLARAIGGFRLWRHDPLAWPAALLCVLRELPLGSSSSRYRARLNRRELRRIPHWRRTGIACRAGYGRRCRTIPRKLTRSSNRPSKEGSTSRLGPPTTSLGRAGPKSCAASSSGWTTSSSSR